MPAGGFAGSSRSPRGGEPFAREAAPELAPKERGPDEALAGRRRRRLRVPATEVLIEEVDHLAVVDEPVGELRRAVPLVGEDQRVDHPAPGGDRRRRSAAPPPTGTRGSFAPCTIRSGARMSIGPGQR